MKFATLYLPKTDKYSASLSFLFTELTETSFKELRSLAYLIRFIYHFLGSINSCYNKAHGSLGICPCHPVFVLNTALLLYWELTEFTPVG